MNSRTIFLGTVSALAILAAVAFFRPQAETALVSGRSHAAGPAIPSPAQPEIPHVEAAARGDGELRADESPAPEPPQPAKEPMPSASPPDDVLRERLHALAERDPLRALEWAQQVETSDFRLQNELVYGAYARLVERDGAGAARWLEQMSPSRERDEATRVLVDAVTEKDPATAFRWASSVLDSKARSDLMHRTLRHWLAVDATGAQAGVRKAMGEAATRGDQAAVRHFAETLRVAQQEQSALRY